MSKTSYRKRTLKIKYNQNLIYADGPQLILFDTSTTTKFLALAVNYEKFDYPCFGVEISSEMMADYIDQKFDLRYTFTNPTYKKWYLFDYLKFGSDLKSVESIDVEKIDFEGFIPDHGLFSRDHTERYLAGAYESLATHKFNVDGSWEWSEFSSLYNQITDLYVVFNGVDAFLDKNSAIDERKKVQQAFVKPWQGGGSYNSFYDGLANAQRRSELLKFGGIQYNSPGYVDVRGREKPFSDIFRLIERLSVEGALLSSAYDRLYKVLKDYDLLTLAASEFDKRGAVAEVVSREARAYAATLDAIPYNDLFEMAGRDPLIVAKVLLSIYRRAVKLFEFIQKGRVTLPS